MDLYRRRNNMKKTLVISAYTCCGKTYASEHIKNYDILDMDSTRN